MTCTVDSDCTIYGPTWTCEEIFGIKGCSDLAATTAVFNEPEVDDFFDSEGFGCSTNQECSVFGPDWSCLLEDGETYCYSLQDIAEIIDYGEAAYFTYAETG